MQTFMKSKPLVVGADENLALGKSKSCESLKEKTRQIMMYSSPGFIASVLVESTLAFCIQRSCFTAIVTKRSAVENYQKHG